jgi:hypothetical protein
MYTTKYCKKAHVFALPCRIMAYFVGYLEFGFIEITKKSYHQNNRSSYHKFLYPYGLNVYPKSIIYTKSGMEFNKK